MVNLCGALGTCWGDVVDDASARHKKTCKALFILDSYVHVDMFEVCLWLFAFIYFCSLGSRAASTPQMFSVELLIPEMRDSFIFSIKQLFMIWVHENCFYGSGVLEPQEG